MREHVILSYPLLKVAIEKKFFLPKMRIFNAKIFARNFAEILLVYSKSLDEYKTNIKDFALKFVLTSKYSPISPIFERKLNNLIQDTENSISFYTEKGLAF